MSKAELTQGALLMMLFLPVCGGIVMYRLFELYDEYKEIRDGKR